jgi:hypothetical protein
MFVIDSCLSGVDPIAVGGAHSGVVTECRLNLLVASLVPATSPSPYRKSDLDSVWRTT